ncbi:MAG TPA: hypothetical protein VK585_16940 [Jiangellaceae bacterium]|nr:hypothetical protein [Jiangellaceae bacterium]
MRQPDAGSFPEYQSGFRLIDQSSTSNLTEDLVVTGTYVGHPFASVYRFDASQEAWVNELVTVGEQTFFHGGSSPGIKEIASPPNAAEFQDLEMGARIEVTLTFGIGRVTAAGPARPAPDAGTASLSLYEWVGPDQFPYPDPPASLTPLQPLNLTPDRSVVMVQSDPLDPAAEQTGMFRWPFPPADFLFSMEMRAQTPGMLRLLLGGSEVGRGYWWDYRQAVAWSSACLDRTATDHPATLGDEGALTVIPERMTGAWAVALYTDSGMVG